MYSIIPGVEEGTIGAKSLLGWHDKSEAQTSHDPVSLETCVISESKEETLLRRIEKIEEVLNIGKSRRIDCWCGDHKK